MNLDRSKKITEILSKYREELEKEDSIKNSDKLLNLIQIIYNKQLEAEQTLAKLKGQNKEPIETSNPVLFSHTPKNEDEKITIEEMGRDRNLNKILDLATNLILRHKR